MATFDENGNVLHEGWLRMAQDTGLPYDRITPALYRAYKAAQYAKMYSAGPESYATALRRIRSAEDVRPTLLGGDHET